MAKPIRLKDKHKKKNHFLTVVLSLVFMVGVSFAIALVWQTTQDMGAVFPFTAFLTSGEPSEADAASLPEPGPSSAVSSSMPVIESAPEEAESEAADESAGDEESADESDYDEYGFHPPREDYPHAVKASEKVANSYFNDAIFFGDSISTGITNYNIMPDMDVIAYIGISTVNALTKECIETGDGLKTMLDAAAGLGDKKKVYIMLGGNGLGYDKETFIRGYVQFLDAVKYQYPDAVIYVQTMTPVTDYAYKTYPLVNNDIIDEYNLAIHDMAVSEKVYLVDTACAFMDSSGKLPERASPVDGMHFGPEYYHRWFDYLKTHTVQ